MHLCAQYYGQPSENLIREYAEELAQYLNEGYVEEYEFGYQKDGRRLVTWRYKVDESGLLTTDERPGKVVPYADVTGASFFNYLTRNYRFSGGLVAVSEMDLSAPCHFAGRLGSPPPTGLVTGHRTGIITPADAV